MVNFRGFANEAEFFLEVARGNVPGISHINKFGRSPDLDQISSVTTVPLARTIWDGGVAGAANWVPPTTARIHQIASTDVDDNATGAGARTVRIFGLDADFLLQDEIVTLNGQNNVPTANTYTMIHRMQVLTKGATGYNEGNLTATADGDGTVTAQITATFAQTLMAIYQIPANKKGYMPHFDATLHKRGGGTKLADVALLSMEVDGPWRIRDAGAVASDGGINLHHDFDPWKVFQSKELVQVAAAPSADAQDMSAGFDLVLVDN